MVRKVIKHPPTTHTQTPGLSATARALSGFKSQAPLGQRAFQGLDYMFPPTSSRYLPERVLDHRDAQAAAATFWAWTSRLRHCTGARPLAPYLGSLPVLPHLGGEGAGGRAPATG